MEVATKIIGRAGEETVVMDGEQGIVDAGDDCVGRSAVVVGVEIERVGDLNRGLG